MQKSCAPARNKLRWMVVVAGLAGSGAGSPLAAAEPGAAGSLGGESTMPEVSVRDAGERPDGPVSGYRATRSSTFTKTDTPLREVPASISVVPGEVMKDTAMQGMGDVIRYVPGALMHQGEGNRDQVILRGNSTTADFFVDGVRDDAQVFRDLYNLERVEVLKGPAGMAFGRGGAGGVVNRVTRRPVFDRVGEAGVTLGSNGQLRTTVDLGNRLGESAAWRLNAMAENADSFRNGVALNRRAFNPAVTWLIGDRTAFTLGYEHMEDDRTADRGVPSSGGRPFNTAPGKFFGNANQSDARSTVDGMYAVLEHDLGGGFQVRNTARATHYDKFYQNVYPGSAVSANGTMTLSAYNNANRRTNLFNQTDLTGKIRAWGVEHTLLVGMEIGRQNSYSKRNTGFFGAATSVTVSASSPYAVATRFAPNGTDADNFVRSNTSAIYVQDQIALSKQWKVIAGARYDRFGVDMDDRRTTTPATDLSRTDRAISPRAGLIWSPDARSTYYASYSFAFLPSGEQLSLATTTSDLAPEKSRNYELGARWDVLPELTLSGAVFRNDRDDVRVADPVNAGQFVKSGQQRTEGVEIGLQGEVMRNWQVYGGAAFLNGRITRPISTGTTPAAATVVPAGNRIGLVPQRTLSLWNRFNHGGGWGSGVGVIHQSSSFTSYANTVTLPAFTRIDAAVYRGFSGGKTRIAFNIENLFNRRYFPTVDGDNNISPGAPRTLRVTAMTGF